MPVSGTTVGAAISYDRPVPPGWLMVVGSVATNLPTPKMSVLAMVSPTFLLFRLAYERTACCVLRIVRIEAERSEPFFQARAPTKRIEMRESRTRMTTVNSRRVIPDFAFMLWVLVSFIVCYFLFFIRVCLFFVGWRAPLGLEGF